MRLEGRKLILEESFDEIIEYITITNIDKEYIYEILYNGVEHSVQISNESLVFKLPNKKEENTISLRVYNSRNQYLFSTNTIILTNKVNNNADEKFKEEYYIFQKDIIKKYLDLENLLNNTSKNLSQKDKEILDKISILCKNLDYSNDINSIQNKINDMDFYNREEINKICKEIQDSISNLELTNKELMKNISKMESKSNDIINDINDFKKNTSENLSNVKDYDDTYLKSKIENNESFCKELDNNLKKLNELYNQMNYQEQINEILQEIAKLDNTNELNEIKNEIKENKNHTHLDIKNEINELKNIVDTNSNNEEILKINNFIKEHSHKEIMDDIKAQQDKIDKINLNIERIEKNIYNKLKSEYNVLVEKYNALLKEHKEFNKNKNIFLPINIENKIEPFRFVNSKNGNIEKYSYSAYRSPIGVSDEYGNVIIRGTAKVEYANDIFEGDFVYGNKDGIAESYDKGYLVTKIIDKNYCEIII